MATILEYPKSYAAIPWRNVPAEEQAADYEQGDVDVQGRAEGASWAEAAALIRTIRARR